MSPRFRWSVGRSRSEGPPPAAPGGAPRGPAAPAAGSAPASPPNWGPFTPHDPRIPLPAPPDGAAPPHTALPAAFPADGAPDTLSRSGVRIAGELRTLAAAGRTGALHVVGQPGGLVYLEGGSVVQVEAWTTPGAEAVMLRRALGPERWVDVLADLNTSQGRDAAVALARDLLRRGAVRPVDVDLIHQRAVADAACALLTTDDATLTRTRFLREERPWLSLSAPLTVTDLVDLACRQGARLAEITARLTPDTPVTRAAALPHSAVRLSATQWDLVVHAAGTSPRDLAWLLGRGVVTTTLEVARLADLGVVEPGTLPVLDPAVHG